MEDMRVSEPPEEAADDIPQEDGRLRTRSADHAKPTKKCMEARTDIFEDQKPVRQQPGGGERRQTTRENMDMEEGTMGWSKSGNERTCDRGRDAKMAATVSLKKQKKKLKIDRHEETPPYVDGVDRGIRD
jgi:hypothetical protein